MGQTNEIPGDQGLMLRDGHKGNQAKAYISYTYPHLSVCLVCMLRYLSSSSHIWAARSRLGVHSRLHIFLLCGVNDHLSVQKAKDYLLSYYKTNLIL